MIKFKKGLNAKITSFLIAVIFIFNNTAYGIETPARSHLRVPVGKNITYKRMQKIDQAILITGGAPISQQHEQYNLEVSRLITTGEGNPSSLFTDRKAQMPGEKDISKHDSESEFFKALRALQTQLPEGFDVIILDGIDDLPIDMALHPGHTRNQTYIALSDINILEKMYDSLHNKAYKKAFIAILLEGFKHEAAHISIRKSLKGKTPSEIERIVDQEAPSFRIRELFRLVYLNKKLSSRALKPNVKQFLDSLQKEKASHLFAYSSLPIEKHLKIADILVSHGAPNIADLVLARHHIGHVLAHELFKGGGINSALFKRAAKLLQKKSLIPVGLETRRQVPLYTFIRELIRSDMVALMSSIEDVNIKVSSLEQLEPWQRGDEEKVGDSVRFPMHGKTMALPITIEMAESIIEELTMSPEQKQYLKSALRKNKEGHVIISREDLDTIGISIVSKTAMATNGAGRGSRFAEVVAFDGPTGKPLSSNNAKGVYRLPIDGGKSFVEILLAQVADNNRSYKRRGLTENIPVCIYTSYLTDQDIRGELVRIGYQPITTAERDIFQHSNKWYSKVQIIRIHDTQLLDKNNGDAFMTVDQGIDWGETMWPDAHDSSFIDLITSGVAWGLINSGKEYVFISNIDNLTATMEPALLAIMKLTGNPLLSEVSLNVGQPGGAPLKLKQALFKYRTGLFEAWNMDPKFLQGLSPDDAKAYLPLFNTANYCINMVAYVKEVFLQPINPNATDADAKYLLKQFFDARGNPEERAELKFKLLEARYRFVSQFWEHDKRYAAVQPANLAGTQAWFANTIFVEVPQGDGAGATSRYEPQKGNIANLIRMVKFLKKLKTKQKLFGEDKDVLQRQLEDIKSAALSRAEKAELSWIQATIKVSDTITISGLLDKIDREILIIKKRFNRIKVASKRYYPIATKTLSTEALDKKISSAISAIKRKTRNRTQELMDLEEVIFNLDPHNSIVMCLNRLRSLYFELYHTPNELLAILIQRGPPFDNLSDIEIELLKKWLNQLGAFEDILNDTIAAEAARTSL